MKLAELSTRYPPGPGGVERHVGEIARRLGARGHRVRVLTSDLLQEFPWERLPVVVPRHEETPFGSVDRLSAWSLPGELHYPFLRGLERALSSGRDELLHVHTYGTNQVAAARHHHRRTGVPYVLTAHFHPMSSTHGGWTRHRLRAFYDRQIGGPTLAAASRLIVQSREEERLLSSLGFPLPPVRIVAPGYTPLPRPAAPDAFRRHFGIPGPFLLFVGRLASNKGLLKLLEAFAPLARRFPDASLVLVGADGGMRTALELKIRSLDLARRVWVAGYVADDALLAAAFAEARAFALPSEYESFGLVLLEALAQGTPVIASRVGGIPEFIEEGRAGLLVPPGDVRALTEAIERLWTSPGLARSLGEYGRDETVPRFTWESSVDRLEEVFREALGASRRSS